MEFLNSMVEKHCELSLINFTFKSTDSNYCEAFQWKGKSKCKEHILKDYNCLQTFIKHTKYSTFSYHTRDYPCSFPKYF